MARPHNPLGSKNEKPWREAIQRAVKRYQDGHKDKSLDQLANKLVKCGLDGDIGALKEIGDRLDGKATQHNEHSGKDGKPIEVKVSVNFVNGSKG